MKKSFVSKVTAVFCIVMIASFAQVFPVAANSSHVAAAVDVHPDTINLKANGNFITAYIELSDLYDVEQIDIGTVSLEVNGYTIPAESELTAVGDYDDDGVPDLMVKFDRQFAQGHMFVGSEDLIVSGGILDPLASFQGSDTVNVISKGVSLTILQTSDIHHHASGYGPFLDYTPGNIYDNDSVLGGYARLATVIKQVREEQAESEIPVLLLDSGDFFMGTTYDLTALDPIALKFFQFMEYDAVTLGNHEFDWAPAGLYMLLDNAVDNGFSVPVLATNTITDSTDSADDGIEYLMSTGVISDKKVIELPNGLTVGLLGQMGPDSVEKAPVASPITFEHGDFLQDYVEALKDNDGADMVIVLSHGGVETDGTGDDADLAADVEGIDIIASGHFHTATHDAIMTGPSNTIIFSPGEYGEWVSRIDITYNDDLSRIVDYEFTLIPVDDTVPGDPFIQFIVEQYHAGINAELDPLYLSKPVSSTSFALEKEPLQVTGIGSLCADSLRAVASSLAPINDGNQYHVGIVASGVIRDSIYPGKTGVVTFSDVYNMLPLGISPYDPSIPGYPLMSIYASAADVYKICEVALTFAPSMGSDYYLNFSGIKIDYNPFYAQWLQGVRAVYVYAPADALCLGPLGGYDDPAWLNPSDAAFYHIVVDLYALQMLNGVNSYLIDLGIDPIVPRDAAGIPIDFSILANYRIDKDPSPVSFQELKEWMAPLTFLPGITEGDPPVPVIPSAIYGPSGTALGRVNFVSY